jgi:Capsule assembly protein Wzi
MPTRQSPRDGNLRTRFGLACRRCIAAAIAAGSAAAAPAAGEAPTYGALRLQQDPFERLRAAEQRRIASSWSSLPPMGPCDDGRRGSRLHVLALAESSSAAEDLRAGRFDLIDPRYRAQIDADLQLGCFTGQLAVQRVIEPQGERWAMDGSAASIQLGEQWRIGAGLIARQWGPAWDGSLILGASARPIASVSLDAASGVLPETSLWSWLGEIDFSTFFGELDDDREDYARPYLMGARLVLRPWPWLELGASRTSQWGGEGRDNSWRAFWSAIVGRDNQDGPGGMQQQPGNQLGGFDARADLSMWWPGVALYGQMIGEDEAANLPSKYMRLAGAEWRGAGAMAFAEWTDSTAKYAGVAYNHFIYTDGYRHKARPLGRVFGGQGLAVLRYGTLNRAGVNPTWPASSLTSASAQWRTGLFETLRLSVALDVLRLGADPVLAAGMSRSDTQLRVQLEWWPR